MDDRKCEVGKRCGRRGTSTERTARWIQDETSRRRSRGRGTEALLGQKYLLTSTKVLAYQYRRTILTVTAEEQRIQQLQQKVQAHFAKVSEQQLYLLDLLTIYKVQILTRRKATGTIAACNGTRRTAARKRLRDQHGSACAHNSPVSYKSTCLVVQSTLLTSTKVLAY